MLEFSQNVSSYLIQRLYNNGVRHIFGVPGDFVLGFYQQLVYSNKLKVINTCDEQGCLSGYSLNTRQHQETERIDPALVALTGRKHIFYLTIRQEDHRLLLP